MKPLFMLQKLKFLFENFFTVYTLLLSWICLYVVLHMQQLSMLQKLTFCLKTFSTKFTLLHSWTLSVRSSSVCYQNCVLVWKLLAHKSQFLPRMAFHLWTSTDTSMQFLHTQRSQENAKDFLKSLLVDGQITLHVVPQHALTNSMLMGRYLCIQYIYMLS